MSKAIVSIIGVDRVGIVAGISTVLAEHNANIVNISQTNFEDIFTMIMLVDISRIKGSFEDLQRALEEKGKELGVQVNIQREEIFRYMHRI
jgi:ACT domain-containing protein